MLPKNVILSDGMESACHWPLTIAFLTIIVKLL